MNRTVKRDLASVGLCVALACRASAAINAHGPEPSEIPEPAVWQILLAVTLWVLSLFFLHQSAAFLRWVLANQEAAPRPASGVRAGWAISIGLLVLWLLSGFPHGGNMFPGFLLASIAPAGIAVFYFLATASYARNAQQGTFLSSPVSTLIGAAFSAVQLIASIATLVMFFGKR